MSNRQPATDGLDAQSLEDAKLRAPQELRSRARAVTADDYEHIASSMEGVARAYCLTPGSQLANPQAPKPGHVGVLILPRVTHSDGLVEPADLLPPPELLQRVREKLDQQRLIGTTLDVRAPRFVWVSVSVTLHVAERTDPAVMEDVRAQGEAALYRYLNPYTGGPHGSGWPLGRDLNRSELFGLLQQIPLVEYADRLRVTSAEAFDGGAAPASQHLVVPFDALVASGHHQVKVAFATDEG